MAVEMGIDPQQAHRLPGHPRDTAPRSDRHGMIAADDDRKIAGSEDMCNFVGQAPA
jgi:hypothetical protein